MLPKPAHLIWCEIDVRARCPVGKKWSPQSITEKRPLFCIQDPFHPDVGSYSVPLRYCCFAVCNAILWQPCYKSSMLSAALSLLISIPPLLLYDYSQALWIWCSWGFLLHGRGNKHCKVLCRDYRLYSPFMLPCFMIFVTWKAVNRGGGKHVKLVWLVHSAALIWVSQDGSHFRMIIVLHCSWNEIGPPGALKGNRKIVCLNLHEKRPRCSEKRWPSMCHLSDS